MPAALGFDFLGPVTTGAKILNGVASSAGFSIPLPVAAMTIWVPALDATSTFKLQSLLPANSPETTPVWQDVWYWDSGTATFKQLISAAADVSRTVVVSAVALPGGHVRITTSINQTADRQFYVWFSQINR